ncbi:lysophospholipase [Roseiconus nitratireducens]|uniref:Lysophospholipase n=1 Tax=Roseiconus nitratireducens TaxID=2605748 RepID=A0A5M6D3V8_9BACT|nr:lysophospholipase [Roseiconus nitratireducens]KAA5540962.1 lysophospholipase [Roseiconus nitratireducens]
MIHPRKVRYGSLDSYVIDPADEGSARAGSGRGLVVLCHGYGAPGTDMMGIVAEWVQLLGDAASRFRFVCPIAPHSLAELGMPDGRAWWPLNMARLMEAVQARRFDQLHQETPPGIDQAREALTELINAALGEMSETSGGREAKTPLAIGGFSQGAMLTMDTALRGEIPAPDYLMQFSGTVICQAKWTAALKRLEHTRVYQSHGTIDPILPYSSAERLRDLLGAAGIDAEFHSFEGPHTIDLDSIVATAQTLRSLA